LCELATLESYKFNGTKYLPYHLFGVFLVNGSFHKALVLIINNIAINVSLEYWKEIPFTLKTTQQVLFKGKNWQYRKIIPFGL
jgi:hypothetical protein